MELHRVAEALRQRSEFHVVQPAYLELAEPSISAGGQRCVAAGAGHVILLPFFLSPGRHVTDDLSAARDDLARTYPQVRFTVADALGSHPLILDALLDRAWAAQSEPEKACSREPRG